MLYDTIVLQIIGSMGARSTYHVIQITRRLRLQVVHGEDVDRNSGYPEHASHFGVGGWHFRDTFSTTIGSTWALLRFDAGGDLWKLYQNFHASTLLHECI